MAINKDEIVRCTEEEDAIINAQIAAGDPDEREWTDEDFANALSYKELLAKYPELAAFDHHKAKANAPKPPEREKVSVGIDIDIVRHYQKSGEGWEKRLNQVLRSSLYLRGVFDSAL